YSTNNGTTYQGSGTFSGATAGSYTVAVKDANNCVKTAPLVVTQPTLLVANGSAGTILCNGGTTTITVTASGGTSPYQYSTNNGATYQGSGTFSGATAGSYTVAVKDANNCVKTAPLVVSEPALLTANGSAGTILCNGGTTTITVTAGGGTSPYQYSTNNGTTYQGSGTCSGATAGSYTVAVKDANNCVKTAPLVVTEPALLTANGSAGTILCNGGTPKITVTG